MLIAFLLYNDGIQTMIKMSSIYGAEIGLDANAQIGAYIVVQFVGIPFSFIFGALAGRIGVKTSIFIALVVYTGISVLGYFMTAAWQFFALAFLVGTVQGGSQALSRSLFARMIPKEKSSEYFGFFSVFEKFAGIAGPALFAASVTAFGSSRPAVLSLILFFVLGAVVLTRVDVAAGESRSCHRRHVNVDAHCHHGRHRVSRPLADRTPAGRTRADRPHPQTAGPFDSRCSLRTGRRNPLVTRCTRRQVDRNGSYRASRRQSRR
jgi:UMF1 family MFS transporter